MAIHYCCCFIWITMLQVSASPLTENSQVQGCSLVGLDLQNCLVPSTKIPLSLKPCCTTLDQALEAGCYCLRSFLGPSNFPVLSTELALSFSICYISLPSLNRCHVSVPVEAPPPPPLLPLPPVLMPPNLPPNLDEIPPNNSSVVEKNPFLSGSPLPKLSIPERRDYLSSANIKILQNLRNSVIVTVLCMMI